MFSKVKAIWAVFQAGKSVANPALWKAHQVSVTMIAGLLIALVQLVKMFGYDVPIDSDTATAIAGGVLAAVNVVLTIISTDKIGIGGNVDSQSFSVKEQANDHIDADTRERAKAWAAQQHENNGFKNDA